MGEQGISSKERVDRALRFNGTDRVPQDFTAVPEIWQGLGEHFGTQSRREILEKLDIDCRLISYEGYCDPPGVEPSTVDTTSSPDRVSTPLMWRKKEANGLICDVWGARFRWVNDGTGMCEALAGPPLEKAQSLEDLKAYAWPEPDWWNFDNLRADIKTLNAKQAYHIRYRVGAVFETAWALYGFERFLLDLALDSPLPIYVMERITEIHLENLKTVMEKAGDLIDVVYFYDDLASQTSLLMSADMYGKSIRPFHQKIIDAAKGYGKPVMIHSCGAVYPLIETFINMGINILNPIQPKASGMQAERLKKEFGNRMTFHGGVDIQSLLPKGTFEEVAAESQRLKVLLGEGGGYVFAPAHNVQADTPVKNVLAMYD
jgi:uroporphyrinogen decarboxylase